MRLLSRELVLLLTKLGLLVHLILRVKCSHRVGGGKVPKWRLAGCSLLHSRAQDARVVHHRYATLSVTLIKTVCVAPTTCEMFLKLQKEKYNKCETQGNILSKSIYFIETTIRMFMFQRYIVFARELFYDNSGALLLAKDAHPLRRGTIL